MASLKRELVSRVNNIDKMASLISKMPALTGAIEFQSFNQLDVVIDNMFKDDTCLKKFFIVDDGENILHSISSSVVGSMKIPAGLVRKSKSSVYNFVNGKLYLLKEVKSQFSDTSYQIYFEVDYLKILNERLELLKLEPLNSIELELSTNKTNFDFLVLNDLDRQLSYLGIYFSKNLLKLISLFLLMFFMDLFLLGF